MPFLALNGWTVPVADGSSSSSPEYVSETGSRTWDNRLLRERSAITKAWEGTSLFLRSDVADTLQNLLDGKGHRFNFDGHLFSSSGLGPESGSGAATPPNLATQTPFDGLGECQIGGSPGLTWFPGFGDYWTVMYWRLPGTAEHIVVRSDGAKWVDGTRNDSANTNELTVGDGSVNFQSTDIADLVLLPYAACEEFVDAFYTHANANSKGFSNLPRLNASGDATGPLEVLGEVIKQSYVQRSAKSTEAVGWKNNTRSVSFSLMQVKQPTLDRIQKPLYLFTLDTDYRSVGTVEPVWGREPGTEVGAIFTGGGPFGFGQSIVLTGSQYVSLTTDPARMLGGHPGVTVLVWARRNAVGTEQALLGLSANAGAGKVYLALNPSNEIYVGGRSQASDSFQSMTTSAAYTDTSDFHLFGGYLDLPGQEIGAFYDGELVETLGSQAFSLDAFSNEAGTSNNIGNGPADPDTRFWVGLIAMVAIYPRVLSETEVRSIYDQGRRGIFR